MAKQPHNHPKRPRCFAAEIMQLFPAHRDKAISALPDDIRPLVREHVNTAIALQEQPLAQQLAQSLVSLPSKQQRQAKLRSIKVDHPLIADLVAQRAQQLWDEKQAACHD